MENDKASPSLETLAALADALDVPIAWFLLDSTTGPRLVRKSERPRREMLDGLASMTQVDGGFARNIAIFEGDMPVGQRTGFHAHAGDEHHTWLPAMALPRETRSWRPDPGTTSCWMALCRTMPSPSATSLRGFSVYPRIARSELTRDD